MYFNPLNSAPLSLRRFPGKRPDARKASSAATTATVLDRNKATEQRHSRLKMSTTLNTQYRRPVVSSSTRKSIDHVRLGTPMIVVLVAIRSEEHTSDLPSLMRTS